MFFGSLNEACDVHIGTLRELTEWSLETLHNT